MCDQYGRLSTELNDCPLHGQEPCLPSVITAAQISSVLSMLRALKKYYLKIDVETPLAHLLCITQHYEVRFRELQGDLHMDSS